MKKKGLAVIVILLFIGLAFAPSINASIVKDDLVEFEVEFCGLGKKHTVELTQDESDEVEILFNNIEKQLSQVETRDQAEEIFKDAVVELDKYGLLGGLSLRQAKQLVTIGIHETKIMKIIESIYGINPSGKNDKENILCLCYLEVNNGVLCFNFRSYLCIALGLIFGIITDYTIFNILDFFISLFFGIWIYHINNKLVYILDKVHVIEGLNNQEGRLFTIGLYGIKQTDWTSNISLVGFTGIKITTNLSTREGMFFGASIYTC